MHLKIQNAAFLRQLKKTFSIEWKSSFFKTNEPLWILEDTVNQNVQILFSFLSLRFLKVHFLFLSWHFYGVKNSFRRPTVKSGWLCIFYETFNG